MRHNDARGWGAIFTDVMKFKLSNLEVICFPNIYLIIDGKRLYINYKSSQKFTKLIKD